MSAAHIDAYLDRIGYRGALSPTAATLRALHLAHLLAVPFENLDIGLGRPIVLDEAAHVDKIVRRRRGGFCYELNGTFAALLRALGYRVTLLSAGVARDDGTFGPEFDHVALLVEEPEARWLADVGFGDSFREPLRLDEPGDQRQGARGYRLDREDAHLLLSEREDATSWRPQYRFTLQPRRLDDFSAMCHYHQTSPESHFTRRRICSLAQPEGRVTLSDMRLIVTTGRGERQERVLADDEEVAAVLREYFGIELTW